jgi:hypothetical protein
LQRDDRLLPVHQRNASITADVRRRSHEQDGNALECAGVPMMRPCRSPWARPSGAALKFNDIDIESAAGGSTMGLLGHGV